MKCIMCDKDSARYKCRFCKASYCSAACYKIHGDADRAETDANNCSRIIQEGQKKKEAEEARRLAEAAKDVFSDVSLQQHVRSAKPAAAATSSGGEAIADEGNEENNNNNNNNKNTNNTNDIAAEEEEDGDVFILKEKHLNALVQNKDVTSALRSQELQSLLTNIDSMRPSLGLDVLKETLERNQHFAEFCNNVMAAIAEAEGRGGVKRRRLA